MVVKNQHDNNASPEMGVHDDALVSTLLPMKQHELMSTLRMPPLPTPVMPPTPVHNYDYNNDTERRVRFSDDTTTHDYIHQSEYTANEKHCCWFTRSEMRDIKRECAQTIQTIGAYLPLSCYIRLEDDTMCMRGLEARTVAGFKKRRGNIETATVTVLEEQDHQQLAVPKYIESELDWDAVAHRYIAVSRVSQNDALATGLKDLEDALWIHCESGSILTADERKLAKMDILDTMKRRRQVLAKGRSLKHSLALQTWGRNDSVVALVDVHKKETTQETTTDAHGSYSISCFRRNRTGLCC